MDQIVLPPLLELPDDAAELPEAPSRHGAQAQRADHDEEARAAGAVPLEDGGESGMSAEARALQPAPGDDGEGALEPRPLFPTMQARAAYARSKLAAQRATKKLKVAQASAATAQADLALAAAVLPNVGRLLQKGKRSRVLNKATTKPIHYCAMALGAFLASRQMVNLGIKRKKLIAAAADLVCKRQARGLRLVAMNAAKLKSCADPPSSRQRQPFLVCAYSHEWDETTSVIRRVSCASKYQLRKAFLGVPAHTLVQRGTFHFAIATSEPPATGSFREEWVSPPRIVKGTASNEIFPAIAEGMPHQLDLRDLGAVRDFTRGFDACIFQPLGDRASSNLSIMKMWGQRCEENLLDNLGIKCLYWPDTCQAHSHHRGKLELKTLQHHTVRHFSLANLHRLPSVQDKLVASVERGLESRLVRLLEPPPEPTRNKLKVFFDILYDMDSPSHQRKKGMSVFYKDVELLLQVANGDMGKARIQHFCRGEHGKLCCSSFEESLEKYTVAVLNLVLAAEGIPCESRWTNLLPNMRKTLVKQVVHGLGACPFAAQPATQAADSRLDAEAAARADYITELNAVRARRANEYLNDASKMQELAVLTIVLGVADQLLFELLGGIDRSAPPCKAPDLLRRESSIIGRVLSEMLQLFDEWAAGGQLRRPWCVLDLVGAPLKDQAFAKWSRAQIVRLTASLCRRYEYKFAAWPYRLFRTTDGDWSLEERREVASQACQARRCCLDTFTHGIQRGFGTPEALLSDKCNLLLTTAFAGHRLTTDWSERQNAEVQAVRRHRGRALDFTNFAKESLLKQVRLVHMRSGGTDPANPPHLKASVQSCQASRMPLLAPLGEGNGPEVDNVGVALGPASNSEPAAMITDGLVASSSSAAGSSHEINMLTMRPPLGIVALASSVVAAKSPCEPDIVLLDAGEEPEPQSEKEPETKKVGLNPFLVFRNKYLKSAKAAAGRKLTSEEVKQLGEQAKARWNAIDNKTAHVELYHSWRDAPGPPEAPPPPPYVPVWGGGTRGSPISAAELAAHHKESGWPKDDQVFDESAFHIAPDSSIDFQASASFNLWGCSRSALGICWAALPRQADFDLVHKGLCNFIDFVPRKDAESGSLMVMVEGRLRADGATLGREIVVIAGTTWSPKVFDVALCQFDCSENERSLVLETPFLCCLSSRALCVRVHQQGGGGGRQTRRRSFLV